METTLAVPADDHRSPIHMKPTSVAPAIASACVLLAFLAVNYYELGLNRVFERNQSTNELLRARNALGVRGWPIASRSGSFTQAPLAGGKPYLVSIQGPLGGKRNFYIQEPQALLFRTAIAVVNIGTGILLMVGTFLGLRRLCENRDLVLRFSIRNGMILTAVAALMFAMHDDFSLLRSLLDADTRLPKTRYWFEFLTVLVLWSSFVIALVSLTIGLRRRFLRSNGEP